MAPGRPARRWRRGWRRSASTSSSARGRSTGPWRPSTSCSSGGRTASLEIDAGDNAGAADADLVVIATPWDGATQTAVSVEAKLARQGRHLDGQRPRPGRQRVPAAGPAPWLGRGVGPGRRARTAWWRPRSTTCRPRSSATSTTRSRATSSSAPTTRRPPQTTSEIVAKIPNMRPLDAGELSLATPIEAFTAVLLQLNVRYKTRVGGQVHRHPGRQPRAELPPSERRAALRHRPPRRSCRSSRARSSRCTRAASRRTTPPTSATPRSTSPTTSSSGGCVDLGHDAALRAQHHRRRRLHPPQGPRARRPLPRPRRGRDRPVRRRHGGPRAAAGVVGAAGHLGHRRHPRLHRHGARPGPRLPGRRRRLLRRVDVRRRSASVSHLHARRDARARRRAGRQRRRPQQARPARLRAVAAVARRTSRRGSRCGGRAGRAGTSSARRSPCASSARPSTCTAAAPT